MTASASVSRTHACKPLVLGGEIRTLVQHTSLYLVAKVAPGIVGVLTTSILTRFLAPGQYGVYGLALVIMAIGSSVGFEWLRVALIRFHRAGQGDQRSLHTIICLFLAMIPASATVAAVVWMLSNFEPTHRAIYVVGIGLIWSYSWFELVSAIEIANSRPLRYLQMALGRALLILIGAVAMAALTRSPLWTAVGLGVGQLAGATLGSFTIRGWSAQRFDRDLARRLLRFGIPLAASMTLAALINGGVRIMVGTLGSLEALGLFTAAFLLVQNTLVVVGSGVSTAAYHLAVLAVQSGNAEMERQQLLDSGALLLAVIGPACLGVAVTANGIAQILVGSEFRVTVAALTPWMAAAAFFASFRAYYLDYAFQLGRRTGLQAGVMGIAAILGLTLGVYLIPRLGPLGGAIAVTAAMATSCLLAAIVGRWAHPVPWPGDAIWRVSLASIVMALLVRSVAGTGIPRLGLQIAVGVGGYVVAALALNVLGVRARALSLIAVRRITRP